MQQKALSWTYSVVAQDPTYTLLQRSRLKEPKPMDFHQLKQFSSVMDCGYNTSAKSSKVMSLQQFKCWGKGGHWTVEQYSNYIVLIKPYISQGSRLDDQRCAPPPTVTKGPTVPDEDFFSLILRSQGKRMDEQRVFLPSDLKRPSSS